MTPGPLSKDEWNQEEQRLRSYLAAQDGDGWRRLEKVWGRLRDSTDLLFPIPACWEKEEPEPDWGFEQTYALTWSRPRFYAEIELNDNGTYWCYIRDLKDNESFCDEGLPEVPEWFVEKLLWLNRKRELDRT